MYVTELVAPGCVNTMPEKTMEATADHGVVTADAVTDRYEQAQQTLDAIVALGISYADVVATLEREGVEKFITSWESLLADVGTELAKQA